MKPDMSVVIIDLFSKASRMGLGSQSVGFDIVFVTVNQYRMAGKALVWMRAFEEVAREQGFRAEHERDPDAEFFGKSYRIELQAAGERHVVSKRIDGEGWRLRNLDRVVVKACPSGRLAAEFRESLHAEIRRAYTAFDDAHSAAMAALEESNRLRPGPFSPAEIHRDDAPDGEFGPPDPHNAGIDTPWEVDVPPASHRQAVGMKLDIEEANRRLAGRVERRRLWRTAITIAFAAVVTILAFGFLAVNM